MQIRFLNLERDEIFLLGYSLTLSPTEEKLLRAIAEGGKRGSSDLALLLPAETSVGNVAVHISSINKKAAKISGRKLIIHENGRYEINPFM